jgi:hypothetical protein
MRQRGWDWLANLVSFGTRSFGTRSFGANADITPNTSPATVV